MNVDSPLVQSNLQEVKVSSSRLNYRVSSKALQSSLCHLEAGSVNNMQPV